MQEFGNAKDKWFRQYLELPISIPSDDTLRAKYALNDRFILTCGNQVKSVWVVVTAQRATARLSA